MQKYGLWGVGFAAGLVKQLYSEGILRREVWCKDCPVKLNKETISGGAPDGDLDGAGAGYRL